MDLSSIGGLIGTNISKDSLLRTEKKKEKTKKTKKNKQPNKIVELTCSTIILSEGQQKQESAKKEKKNLRK